MGAKIKTFNHGIYAGLIRQYVDYKRSLGFKMDNLDRRLRRFDTLTIERKESKTGISKALFEAWSQPCEGESEQNRYRRICTLRGFSAYLQLVGYDSYIPQIKKCHPSSFTPYIFTNKEIESIFEACDKLLLNQRRLNSPACVMPVIIRTLYATGIRIGEAVRLKHKDVDLDAGYFALYGCKNGRDRVVPFSLSLREVCRDYVVYKQFMMMGTKPDDFFFMSSGGRPCLPTTIYNLFRIVLARAGISHGGKGKGPRLHDLRHTYCLNALVKMSEAGHDLYYSMPILMTCMGHQSIEATNHYVRLTAEMYPDMLNKVNEAYKYVFPEIGIDIENENKQSFKKQHYETNGLF